MSVYNSTPSSDELYHHGVIGMHWGIRRYQRKDGSLTPAGQKHRAKLQSELDKLDGKDKQPAKPKYKKYSEMDDAELDRTLNRLRKENDYARLVAERQKAEREASMTRSQKAARRLSKTVVPALEKAAKETLENYLKKQGAKAVDKIVGQATANATQQQKVSNDLKTSFKNRVIAKNDVKTEKFKKAANDIKNSAKNKSKEKQESKEKDAFDFDLSDIFVDATVVDSYDDSYYRYPYRKNQKRLR